MSKAQQIVDALGGFDNIVEIEPCITRLRCEVEDSSLVDEAALKATGAHGVVTVGDTIQVVVGPNADTLASDLEDELWPADEGAAAPAPGCGQDAGSGYNRTGMDH